MIKKKASFINKISKVIVPSPAKLNLFLQITSRRADGYHNLQTVFQLLDFSDIMHISVHNSNSNIEIKSNNKNLENENNIIYKAICELKKIQPTNKGVAIYLHKNIPLGGGLGGGSSNAATAIVVLNKLWKLDIEHSILLALGAKLGADIPVFIDGYNSFAEGIGDILTPINLPERWFFVVFPGVHLNTKEMFQNKLLKKNSSSLTIDEAIKSNNNAFREVVITNKIIADTINALNSVSINALDKTSVTGSGSCVFVAFNSYADALVTQKKFLKLGSKRNNCFIAKGSDKSVMHKTLFSLFC